MRTMIAVECLDRSAEEAQFGLGPRRYPQIMSLRTDTFDLAGLRLSAGEGRRLGLDAPTDPFELGGERYQVQGGTVPVSLEISRMNGGGYALLLRFQAALTGPCMRCLELAAPTF